MQSVTKAKMLKVARQTVNLMKKYRQSQSLEAQCRQEGILNYLAEIQKEDLPFEECRDIKRGIGARNMLKYRGMRMILHYLPRGEVLKLQSNRGEIVRYVLHGHLDAKIYTQVEQELYRKA